MAAAGFSAEPTAEQQGPHIIHQTVTCHYHVYAPTTVHVRSNVPRCVTESTSEASSVSPPLTCASQPSHEPEDIAVSKVVLEAGSKPKSEGKRQAFLKWLIVKLAAWLDKVSG